MNDDWKQAEPSLPLHPGDVHIWHIQLDQSPQVTTSLTHLLDPQETLRAYRFHFDHDQRHFIVAHGVMRVILGAYCHLPPQMLRFDTNRFGKPYLFHTLLSPNLRFNLSHTQDHALLAITIGYEVGVDIEYIKPLSDIDMIAQQYFSHSERESLLTLADHDKMHAFYTCWSRKEAFIKALGLGLALPLDHFTVSLVPEDTAKIIHVVHNQSALQRWFLYDLPPIPHCATALATRGKIHTLICKSWRSDTLLTMK